MTDDLAEVGPWAEEKLAALGRYLDAYRLVLKNQSWRTIYFDGFAGGGTAVVRPAKDVVSDDATVPLMPEFDVPEPEQRRLIDGSPRIALSISAPFHRYVFVDPSPDRHRELKELAEAHPGLTIDVRKETVTEAVDWLLSHRITRAGYRGVAFLDPFGANLPWADIEKLARTGVFEVFINFTLHMAYHRMMPADGLPIPSWQARLDEAFGTPEWRDAAYMRGSFSLFDPGAVTFVKRSDSTERLLRLYRDRLKAAFGRVSTPRLIRNTRGSPLYYLIWAGGHAKGLEIAEHILRMGDVVRVGRSNRRGTRT